VIMTVCLLGALTLYTGLFWIVRRAARRMEAQQGDLARQAGTLRVTSEELAPAQKQTRVTERPPAARGARLRATSLLDRVRPFRLDLGPVDLNGVLRDLLGVLQRRLTVARVTVDARLAPDLPNLHADEAQLHEALLALREH